MQSSGLLTPSSLSKASTTLSRTLYVDVANTGKFRGSFETRVSSCCLYTSTSTCDSSVCDMITLSLSACDANAEFVRPNSYMVNSIQCIVM